jgi:hypothetical protein
LTRVVTIFAMPEDADMGHTSNDVLLKDMDKIIA